MKSYLALVFVLLVAMSVHGQTKTGTGTSNTGSGGAGVTGVVTGGGGGGSGSGGGSTGGQTFDPKGSLQNVPSAPLVSDPDRGNAANPQGSNEQGSEGTKSNDNPVSTSSSGSSSGSTEGASHLPHAHESEGTTTASSAGPSVDTPKKTNLKYLLYLVIGIVVFAILWVKYSKN